MVFPRQHLNHDDLLAASRLFGSVDTDVDRRYAVGRFPGITVISNIVEDGAHIGIYDGDHEEEWHADNSFKAELTRATLLYSVITPEHGGENRFADATQAYADSPADPKGRIQGLQATHSIQQLGARQAEAADGQSSASGRHACRPGRGRAPARSHPSGIDRHHGGQARSVRTRGPGQWAAIPCGPVQIIEQPGASIDDRRGRP